MSKPYIIKDWAGNTCFKGKQFPSFEDAWEFLLYHPLYEHLDDKAHDEAMGEYEVVPSDCKGNAYCMCSYCEVKRKPNFVTI